MSIISKTLGLGAKVVRPVADEAVQQAGKVVDPILQKAQETFGDVLLKGVRGDIAVLSRGMSSDAPTIFARIGKDGSLQPLKTRLLCKPVELGDGTLLRRRLDYSMTKTLDGQQVQKTIFSDRLYNRGELAKKSRRVVYDAPNACNGHYTSTLPYGSNTEYDIANGKFYKYIEATSHSNPRKGGVSGTLTYENGHLTPQITERWSYNPNLQGDDIRRKVGTAGFLNPKFM